MSKNTDCKPRIARTLTASFRCFAEHYLRRHFHAVAIHREGLGLVDVRPDDALLVYANHASWWDPLTAIVCHHRLWAGFDMYAPIDAAALARYPMFGRMGFFPVEQEAYGGASNFLKTGRAILGSPGAALWMTPEGRFADVRDRARPLTPGLGHLVASVANGTASGAAGGGGDARRQLAVRRIWCVPVAVEYTFWEERLPELLVWLGEPIAAVSTPACRTKSDWQTRLTTRLRETQAELARAAVERDTSAFELLIGGGRGSFLLYDLWRRAKARWTGRKVRIDHGDKLAKFTTQRIRGSETPGKGEHGCV